MQNTNEEISGKDSQKLVRKKNKRKEEYIADMQTKPRDFREFRKRG